MAELWVPRMVAQHSGRLCTSLVCWRMACASHGATHTLPRWHTSEHVSPSHLRLGAEPRRLGLQRLP